MKHVLNLYVANLGKYNEGELKGGWIVLPKTEEEIEQFLKDEVGIGGYYEEWAIHDYETDFGIRVDEYDNIYELNEKAKRALELYERDEDTILAAIDIWGEEALEFDIDNLCLYRGVENEYDLGEYFAEEFCHEIFSKNEFLSRYFDYEQYGRDIRREVDGGFTEYGFIEYEGWGNQRAASGQLSTMKEETRWI